MKISNLLLVFLFLFVFHSQVLKASNADTLQCYVTELVSLGCLPESFTVNDTIGLSLSNNTDELVYYSVSLEEKIGGQWIVVLDDLFYHERDHRHVKNVRILLPHEQKQIVWILPVVLEQIPKPFGICRFRFEIKDSPFDFREFVRSGEFLID